MRPKVSAVPPALNGIRILTGWFGQSAAGALAAPVSSAAPTKAAVNIVRIIDRLVSVTARPVALNGELPADIGRKQAADGAAGMRQICASTGVSPTQPEPP
jgi:hypothetical protein